MSTHKRIDAICAAVTVLTVVLTILFMNGEALGIASTAAEEASDFFTANDLNADWNTSSATKITLSDSGSRISGNGAYVYNGDVYIVYPGHYVLTGELTDGSVIVAANETDKIWILLDAVTLHCDDSAALRVEQADKVFLTLADGTKSAVSSGAQYGTEVTGSGVDSVIYSRDDLTINGSGSLAVSAAYKHGIVCNDDLAITGGNITISAVQDGIHANDSVRIRDAVLSISAGDDGITVSNDDETAFLYIESGSISIPSCYEGMEAVDITIAGGTIDISPTDDGINANGSGGSSVIRITGGDISIINPSGRDADGLDSNGSIYMEGGTVFISVSGTGSNCAIDYGSENGGECIVSGGTVIACGGSMMAESFDPGSTQGFLTYTASAAAGTVITLEDSEGRELLSAEIPCSFSSAVLSAPGMQLGDVCLLSVGDVQEQVTVDNGASSGSVAAGMFWGGMRGGKGSGQVPGGQDPRDGSSSFGQGDRAGEGRDFQGKGFQSGDGPFGGNSDMQPPEDLPAGGDFQPGDGNFQPGDGGFQPGDGSFQPGDGDFQPEDTSQLPDFRGGGRQMDSFQDRMPDTTVPTLTGSSLILLAVSVVVLLAGLAIALKFRR